MPFSSCWYFDDCGGIVGGTTARFSTFVTWPWTAAKFFVAQLRGSNESYLGHTPIAGWMVLAVLTVQGSLGLFSADPDRLIVEGPLADMVSDETIQNAASLHRLGFNILLGLVSIHIAANLIYAILLRRGYVRAMVTGRKAAGAYVDFAEATAGAIWAALACLVAAVILVFGPILALGGHPFR